MTVTGDAMPTRNPSRYLRSVFGIDPRSLALFRIGVAGLIILDLLSRARDLRAHYTDAGVLPRDAALDLCGWPTYRSLHWYLSASPAAECVLFVVAAVAALALLVGYRTRLATVVSWLLLVSLHARNIDVLGGGDALLRVLLFWSMFIHLGAAYSVDCALDRRPQEKETAPMVSAGAAAILLQVCIVYWFTALIKLGGHTWSTGWAMHYALNFDYCAKPLAVWLRGHEAVLPAVTYGAVWFQLVGPFLLFMPKWTGPFRCFTAAAFMAFHAGTYALFAVGLWPFIGVIAWTLFIPSWFWDRLAARTASRRRNSVTVYYDGDCGFCLRMVSILRTWLIIPADWVRPAQDDPAVFEQMRAQNSWVVVDHEHRARFKFDAFVPLCRVSPVARPIVPLIAFKPIAVLGTRAYEWVAAHRDKTGWLVALLPLRPVRTRPTRASTIFCALMFVYVLIDNAAGVNQRLANLYGRTPLPTIGLVVSMNQRWSLFAPDPRSTDYWYVIEGTLVDGRKTSLFFDEHQPVHWEKPDCIPAAFDGFRWHHYFANLGAPESPARIRLHRLAEYIARDWNARHFGSDRLDSLSIFIVVEETHDAYIATPEPRLLLSYSVNTP